MQRNRPVKKNQSERPLAPPSPPITISRVREEGDEKEPSPRWDSTTKLVIALTFVGVTLFLIFRFLNIVGPLVLTFIMAYLMYPPADWLKKRLHFPWRLGVTLVYLIILLLVLGSLTAGGLALLEQVQNLIRFLEQAITNLPATVQSLISTRVQIGPFIFNPSSLNLDVNTVTQQVLNIVQPILSGAGSLVGTLASQAAQVVGWFFFILLVSYFILAESGGFPNLLTNISLPGYSQDLKRLSSELGRIWNAFLRGQLTIVLIVLLIYTLVLGSYGLKFFIGLAFLAGLARFMPFVGPAIAWTTYGLVAYFQGTTIFGLPPLGYVGLVVGTAWIIDLFIDNFISPRIMADALRVHPAAVMVSALVGANLLGIIGVMLAAPVLATIQLFFSYSIHKLLDQDPWTGIATNPQPKPFAPNMQKEFQQIRISMQKRRFPWKKTQNG